MLGILASIIDGVLVGLVYGLAAMGLTLIWGVMDVINLTHGTMIVAGMFACRLTSLCRRCWSAPSSSAWRCTGSRCIA
jgi:branched-subunit amino acid ABC-type transport system permease component